MQSESQTQSEANAMKTEPEPNATTTWLTEVEYLLSELEGGTLRKLDILVQNMPPDLDMFAAFARMVKRFDAEQFADPIGEAHRMFGGRVGHHASNAGATAAAIVRGLLARIHASIDQGRNDPSDPIIRVSDFKFIGGDGTGRRVGFMRQLPPHLAQWLKDITPIDSGGDGPFVILGSPQVVFVRKSLVARMTNAEHERIAERRAENERIDRLSREAWQRQHATTPEGMAARLAETERQLAALKGAQTAATTG